MTPGRMVPGLENSKYSPAIPIIISMYAIFGLLIAVCFILPNCSNQRSFLKQDTEPKSKCFPESFKRNLYFTGKLLTEQDFNDE